MSLDDYDGPGEGQDGTFPYADDDFVADDTGYPAGFFDDSRQRARSKDCKIVRDCTPEEIAEAAKANHIWINAFSLIHPSQEVLAGIGQAVVSKLRRTQIVDDLNGTSPHAFIHVNAS